MKVAFLVSRQGRALSPDTWWLRAGYAAARWAVDQGWTMVCGSGLMPIDYLRWAYAHFHGSVETISLAHDATGRRTRRRDMRDRDSEVMDRAEVLLAVAVRKGGIMEEEGLKALAAGKRVFVLNPPEITPAYQGNLELLNAGGWELSLPQWGPPQKCPIRSSDRPASETRAKPAPGTPGARTRPIAYARLHSFGTYFTCSAYRGTSHDFLWHFTRGCPGPWPGETADEYFSSLAQGSAGSAHTAMDTLLRILGERKIRASSKIIRGKYPVVSFSAERPDRILSARKFRPALARWDFEPYGIGIQLDAARRIGVRPVAYLSSKEFRRLDAADRPYYQRSEPGSVDWTHEKEWRLAGDLDLNLPAAGDMLLLISAGDIPEMNSRLASTEPPVSRTS